MKPLIHLAVFYYFLGVLLAQNTDSLAVESWLEISPTRNIRWVTQDSEKIYAAATTGILAVDKKNLSVKNYSKADVLNAIKPKVLEANPFRRELIIYYENASIDIVEESGVYNLPDIVNNRLILGSREINRIVYYRQDICLLATDFGLVRLNTERKIFDFTLFTTFRVLDAMVFDGYYWMLSSESIFRIPISSGANFSNFLEWENYSETVGLFLPDMNTFDFFEGHIYVGTDSGLYRVNDQGAELIYAKANYKVNTVRKSAEELLVGAVCQNNCPNELFVLTKTQELIPLETNCVRSLRNFIREDNGRFWIADLFESLIYTNSSGNDCQKIVQNRPPFPIVRDIAEGEEELYFAGRGPTDNFDYTFSSNFFFTFDGNRFNWFNQFNTEVLRIEDGNDFRDLYQVEADPFSNKVYFGSFLGGLIEKEGDNYKVYDQFNSILMPATGDILRTRISGLTFDGEGNLWMTNHGTDRPLVVKTPKGEWFSYDLPVSNVSNPIVGRNGFVWMLSNERNSGVVVFDPGGVPGSGAQTRVRVFSAVNSELESDDSRSLAEDLNGSIWIGTAAGITVFECGFSAFEEICRGSNRVIVQDDFGDLLIGTEIVKSIAVDGANRKWLGTTNGIFVQSADGFENIASYNFTNSPLINDDILNLQFVGKEGLLYVSTPDGLQVLRTTATFAENFVRPSEVLVFPNPVRPDYKGPIYIRGLAKDSNVKITDVRGRIVHETQALGGQAIWNGNDQGGRRAESGVYFVFSTYTLNFENPTGYVTKILLLN
jgi:hypothetical protein